MNQVICVLAFFVTLSWSLTLPAQESQASAISVYTTQFPETPGPNVYQQIATNIAGKITSPILTFLGFGKQNTTQTPLKPTKPLDSLEAFEQPLPPVDNALHPIDRDVEQLTKDHKVQNKKPEKIVLNSNDDDNNSTTDKPSEVSDTKPRDGGFTYFLELLGSIAQLAIGAFEAIFKPATPTTTPTTSTQA